ncbi:MAG: (2,3-dihydroxybenzoyl)adenylate synthase [Candidatus Binatia bacterium]
MVMFEGVVPWPDDFARMYRGRGYWAGVTLGEAFDQSVQENSDRIAVVDGKRRVSYRELGALVDRFALHLVEREISGGKRIVFQLPNVLEFIVAYFACLKVGAIPLTCLPAHRQAEIEYLARFTDAAAWFIPSTFRNFDYVAMAEELRDKLPLLREIFVVGERAGRGMTRVADLLDDAIENRVPPKSLEGLRPDPDAPAVFQLSGGTTGLPKVIPRTHNDYLYNSKQFAAVTDFDRETVILITVPIAHNFPLACPGIQAALLLGARVVLAPSPDPVTVFSLVQTERVTWIPAVPASVITWLADSRRAHYDLTSIKTLIVGGSRLHAEPARLAREAFGPVVAQVYGMAEGLLCCTRSGDPVEAILETQGRPASPDDETKIVDDDGKEVAPGEIGELLCRGPYTIRGYYKAEDYNRTAFTPDGFYRTGDLVRRHPSGNLIVEGRKKDTINRGGEKISAEEVESLILTHPAVLNAAVVAIPDAVLGERACACVVLKPGAALSLEDLGRFLREEKRIARFKLPERLEILDRLPTTAVGKISKKDLREEVRKKLTG